MSEKCGACGSEYGHCDNCAWLKEEIERPTTGETIARLERERSAALAEVERLRAGLLAIRNRAAKEGLLWVADEANALSLGDDDVTSAVSEEA